MAAEPQLQPQTVWFLQPPQTSLLGEVRQLLRLVEAAGVRAATGRRHVLRCETLTGLGGQGVQQLVRDTETLLTASMLKKGWPPQLCLPQTR